MKHSSINKVADYQAPAQEGMSLIDWEGEEQYALMARSGGRGFQNRGRGRGDFNRDFGRQGYPKFSNNQGAPVIPQNLRGAPPPPDWRRGRGRAAPAGAARGRGTARPSGTARPNNQDYAGTPKINFGQRCGVEFRPNAEMFNEAEEDCKLLVYGVNKNMANGDIQAEFEVCGQVVDVYNTGKRLAFVTFDRKEDASAASAKLDGYTLNGQQINVTGFWPLGDGGGGRGGTGAGGRRNGRGREAFRRQVQQVTDKNQLEELDEDPFDEYLSGLEIQDLQ